MQERKTKFQAGSTWVPKKKSPPLPALNPEWSSRPSGRNFRRIFYFVWAPQPKLSLSFYVSQLSFFLPLSHTLLLTSPDILRRGQIKCKRGNLLRLRLQCVTRTRRVSFILVLHSILVSLSLPHHYFLFLFLFLISSFESRRRCWLAPRSLVLKRHWILFLFFYSLNWKR